MKFLKYNIVKPKKYKGRDGREKTQWNNIGVMTVFQKDDGSVSRILEIPCIGLEANIFPIEPKPAQPTYQEKEIPVIEENEINTSEIPF